jgi:alcohol dehydrogenase (cytochrome c)/methanol dehydrogenase (cytochrome c) subunit 1
VEGEEWKRGGGTTWGWYSYDPDLNLLYYGTETLARGIRSAARRQQVFDDDLCPRSGHGQGGVGISKDPARRVGLRRHQRERARRSEHERADAQGLVNFDRNGFAYVLDRKTGELLRGDAFVPVNWAKGIDLKTGKPIEDPEKRTSATKNTKDICPSAMGGKNQQPVSFSPKTGYFYVPSNNLCMDYEGVEVKYQAASPTSARSSSAKAGPAVTAASSWRGIRSTARRCGASRSSCRRGAARSRRPATWSSTGRWKGG